MWAKFIPALSPPISTGPFRDFYCTLVTTDYLFILPSSHNSCRHSRWQATNLINSGAGRLAPRLYHLRHTGVNILKGERPLTRASFFLPSAIFFWSGSQHSRLGCCNIQTQDAYLMSVKKGGPKRRKKMGRRRRGGGGGWGGGGCNHSKG